VLNLALNARDAMPSGGRLTLSTDVISLDGHEPDPHPEVSAGEYVLIAVTDNGEGMTSDVIVGCSSHFTPPRRSAKAAGSA
jgi:signal transduction histidine kinase